MKQILLVFLLVFCSLEITSQEFFNDFEDGTLEGWTNIDGSETGLDNLLDDSRYLQKIADGSATPLGRMAIANVTDTWTGDNYGGGFNIFGALNMQIRNSNNFDLKLRLGFRGGSDNTILVTTNPIVVPQNTWAFYDFPTYDATTVVSGKATLIEVAMNTLEFRIIHSEDVSWDGDVVNGILDIDNLNGVLLDTDDFNQKTITVSPNPFQNELKIELPTDNGTVQIFDVLGRKILTSDLKMTTVLDLQKLNSGIYLAKITTESGSVTKRIIKN